MSDIALRETRTGALRRLATACRAVLLAIADGIAAARQYERLAAMSDGELARLGLTRGELPWFAFTGQRPEPPARDSQRPTSPRPPGRAAA